MSDKRTRVETVLVGRRPDRPPVSFWHHFTEAQRAGQAAVDAHLHFLERYDVDFLKVMNDHLFPRGDVPIVQSVAALKKIRPQAADAGELASQLDVIAKLAAAVGEQLPMCTTVFGPWSTLRQWTRPPSTAHGPPSLDASDDRDETLSRLLTEDRQAVRGALEAIAATLADFARACVQAGADGIFLSVRDDWVNTPTNGPDTYAELVRPADRMLLDAVGHATFNMLHICGRPQDFRALADYPVHVLNWADRSAGPSLAYARDRVRPALAGGVDNLATLPSKGPEDVAAEVHDAVRQAGERPILITAGCTFDPQAVPSTNLDAMIAAARTAYAE